MQRYASVLALLVSFTCAHAQTVLTAQQYDALKAAGQLPEHPVLVADQGTHKIHSFAGTAKGGGGGCGCWVEPDAGYSLAMDQNDDGSSEVILLPFTFTLFGDPYTQLYINNNGNISFTDPYGTFTASGFPSADFMMVAPFWADVDTRAENSGQVLFKVTPTAVYINWVDVGYYSMMTDKKNSFQLIITDGNDPAIPGGNNVSFCYKDMQWTTGAASAGVDGFGGTPATVGANRGNGTDHAQIGRFAWNNDVYGGAYADTSGIDWLDSTHFYMNTIGAGVPPVFGSDFNCDTVVVQMLSDGTRDAGTPHQLIVLPGGPDQQVICTSTAPTLPSFENVNVGPARELLVPFTINTEGAAVGIHYITFTATNDQAVPLSSQYVLQVEVAESISTGLAETGGDGQGLIVSPVPAVDRALISWPVASGLERLTLHAADGRVLRTLVPNAATTSHSLDLTGLAPGTYVVVGQGSKAALSARVVKVGDQ